MANYYPPSEKLPTFDVSVFRETNDNLITQEDADRLYLSRQGVASSLTTSTNFLGQLSCGGNLTLNASTASSRQIQGSFFKLQDNASLSTNNPMIWYPDPSLQITTNDVLGAVKTIDIKSYDGTATNVSTSLSCSYGQVSIQNTLKINNSVRSNFATLQMGISNLVVENNSSGGSVVLKSGIISLQATNSIQYNIPIAPQLGSNPPSNLSYIGGTTIVTGSNLALGGQDQLGKNSTSVTLGPGTYLLTGQIHYSLVTPIEIGFRSWGCGFNSVQYATSTTVGSPYTISNNIYGVMTLLNTLSVALSTAGMRMQSTMNINLTDASTIIYLNFVCYYTNLGTGFNNTVDTYSSIMVTRIA